MTVRVSSTFACATSLRSSRPMLNRLHTQTDMRTTRTAPSPAFRRLRESMLVGFQVIADHVEQHLLVDDRLGQVIVETGAEKALAVPGHGVRGEGDDGQPFRRFGVAQAAQ